MIKISPLMQLSASRTELQSTNAEACCLDTAASSFNDDAASGRQAAINDAWAVTAAALPAPHPSLRATFSPRSGEKE
jgi:hypothetical protein